MGFRGISDGYGKNLTTERTVARGGRPMAVTTARPQRVSPVPAGVFGALGGQLSGYELGVVAGAPLPIKPEFGRGSVKPEFGRGSVKPEFGRGSVKPEFGRGSVKPEFGRGSVKPEFGRGSVKPELRPWLGQARVRLWLGQARVRPWLGPGSFVTSSLLPGAMIGALGRGALSGPIRPAAAAGPGRAREPAGRPVLPAADLRGHRHRAQHVRRGMRPGLRVRNPLDTGDPGQDTGADRRRACLAP